MAAARAGRPVGRRAWVMRPEIANGFLAALDRAGRLREEHEQRDPCDCSDDQEDVQRPARPGGHSLKTPRASPLAGAPFPPWRKSTPSAEVAVDTVSMYSIRVAHEWPFDWYLELWLWEYTD